MPFPRLPRDLPVDTVVRGAPEQGSAVAVPRLRQSDGGEVLRRELHRRCWTEPTVQLRSNYAHLRLLLPPRRLLDSAAVQLDHRRLQRQHVRWLRVGARAQVLQGRRLELRGELRGVVPVGRIEWGELAAGRELFVQHGRRAAPVRLREAGWGAEHV